MATYHVKTGGGTGSGLDDANAWSYAHFNTRTLAAGDVVNFKRGDTFDGAFSADSGSSGNVITYGAYGSGAAPIINGFTTLSSWTLSSGNIYYATLDVSVLHGVTLDGVVKGMGRYPNTGYLQYTSHSANTSITGATIGALPFNCVGAEVVIRKVRWVLDRHIVTAHSSNTITYNALATYGNNNAYSPVDNNGYFIQGHLSCLTEDGDWYYDNAANRFYMYFAGGVTSGRTVKVSTVAQLLTTSGSYMTFNDFNFTGGNYALVIAGASNLTFNSCLFNQQGASPWYGNNTDNITINDPYIEGALNNGMLFEVDCNNITITNPILVDVGIIAGMGSSGDGSYEGIFLIGDNNTVTNPTITRTGFNGIRFHGDNVLIEEALVSEYCSVKDDGAGIYTVESNSGVTHSNRVVSKCICINSVGAYEGAEAYDYEAYGKSAGIYLDDYTDHVEVSDSVCAGNPWAGIFVTSNGNIDLLNNILYNNQAQLWINNVAVGRVRNFTITGNAMIAKTASQYAFRVDLQVNDNPSNYGSLNNNIYARPIDDTDSILVYRNYSGGGGNDPMTIEEWKTYSSQDASSVKSSVTISDDTDFLFEYNHTDAPVDVPLTGTWKDVTNDSFSGDLSVPAFGAKVLLLNTSGFKILTSGGKILTNGGKILIKLT